MASEVKLRKLKEGVERYEVTEVLVAPGDTVEEQQTLLVVNADKANLDVVAPSAGRVVQIRVKVGDELKVGDVYCVLDGANGEGASGGKVERREEAPQEPTPREVKAVRPTAPAAPTAPTAMAAHDNGPGADVILAGPGTRWLARKLGVDLRQVRKSGPNGRVTEDDVKNAFGGGASAPGGVPAGVAVPSLPNFEEFGPVVREGLNPVRRVTAERMSLAWSLIPHVTQHDQADISDLEAFRKQQETRGQKLTVTAFALKAVALALKQFPTFNATLDLAGRQLILKKYYHIGVAVDTKGGLRVPVLRDVDKKSVVELAQELVEVAEKARLGKADMSGGSFTITNLGGIGGTAFTPIVNWPEVAILGLSRSRLTPVVRDGQVVPRLILPLSMSYDHRVIDGADAARFTRRIAEMLENPWVMALHA